jgi:predicted metal-dependent hydrolase
MPKRTDIALIAGRPVRYEIRRSGRARRPAIQVSRRDGVVVVLPRRTPLAEVPELLAYGGAWLERMVAEHDVAEGPLRREYVTGSELVVLGRPRRLVLMPLPAGRKRPRIDLRDEALLLEMQPADILNPRPRLEQWLRRFAKEHLFERVALLAERIGLQPRRIIVGERTTRWGSCSGRGTLSFCYRLVMAPPAVVDAVVAHELCHLRHLNHGRRFYRLLRLACPDHDQRMQWLSEHGDELLL